MEYIINTPCGMIKGVKEDGVISYKGIRYATSKRFEYPLLVTSWDGIYDATKYSHCAYQARSFYNEAENIKKAFYYTEFRKGETYTYSEDCLFLNIFTPEVIDEKLPVLIYIHGGSFTGGCGFEKHFDKPIWPKKGVIGVTINYRLGPLGFACFSEEDGNTGNYGLYDQLSAIKWVKNNIEAFGGDSNNIAIMGQSAGAMSVQQHVFSPLSNGLFQKAIMCSGGGVSKMLSTPKACKKYSFWDSVIKNAGCASLKEFKEIPVEKVFDSYNKTKEEIKVFGMICSPVIDGGLIVGNSNDYKNKKLSYLVGSTSEDIIPPFIHKMSKKWASSQEINSYCYMFNHQLPGDKNGAWHSSDLWYWFGTLENCWRDMNEMDYKLSDSMTSYLCNFVKTGDPNDKSLIEWNPSSKKEKRVLHLGNGIIEMKKVKMGKLWHNMFTKKAVGE